jgi:transposase
MKRFIEGANRHQGTLFPERLDDLIAEDNPVWISDAFVDELDLSGLGFKATMKVTARPGYHPAMLLELYICGYLNRVQSSPRLEREAQRNVESMSLTASSRRTSRRLRISARTMARPFAWFVASLCCCVRS